FEEFAIADASLLSVDAHTAHRIVPICFEGDVFGTLFGVPASSSVPVAGVRLAPQSTIFPDAAARPSSAEVATFLKGLGIDYIFADAKHPNTLVPEAIPIAESTA